MLGAKIGQGARAALSCEVAEYDPVTVGVNAALDDCICRGFAVDNGCMLLGPVGVGTMQVWERNLLLLPIHVLRMVFTWDTK